MSRPKPRDTRSETVVLMFAALLALACCGGTSPATDATRLNPCGGVAYASASPWQTLDLYLQAPDGNAAAPVVYRSTVGRR